MVTATMSAMTATRAMTAVSMVAISLSELALIASDPAD